MYISKEDSVRALHSSELQPIVIHQVWMFVALFNANECTRTQTHTHALFQSHVKIKKNYSRAHGFLVESEFSPAASPLTK